MAIETEIMNNDEMNSIDSIFCICGGVWITTIQNNEKLLICPICKEVQSIPDDTSQFQLRFKN